MLAQENQLLLGIARTREQSAPSRLHVVSTDVDGSYHLCTASSRDERERAYRLAYRVYERLGYVTPSARRLHASAYDLRQDTLTILAEDERGRDVGTVTIIFDARVGLPSDEIYSPEIAALRRRGCRLAEAVRFCIDSEHVVSNVLMRRMLNLCCLYSSRVGRCDYLINECNPHHKAFYLRKLLFEQIGPERPCPRVEGAPAVLLSLDLTLYRRQIERLGGTYGQDRSSSDRTLYPHFYTEEEEEGIAHLLACRQAPMSFEDAIYFGLVAAGSDLVPAA